MEKKYYQIGTQTAEDWSIVHELLMQDGTLEDNIPSRSVECENEILHSPTRSTYLMTDEEAEILKNDPRIAFVNLDPDHYDIIPKPSLDVLKYSGSVKNYRALKVTNDGSTYIQGPPINDYNGRTSGEFYRTGYQILRCAQRNNPWPSNPNTVLNQNVEYNYDGTDVDVIVSDNGVFFGHPEFTYDEFTPPNYIRGNVLSRSGICGVLDLVLDAPYYMDPAWFDASPSTRLERRWDGTLVPKEDVARQWWSGPSFRSPSFFNFGSINVTSNVGTAVTYTRAKHCGANRTTRPSQSEGGDHGTPCASQAYGKNFGWAFNANKWSIARIGTDSLNDETVFNITKIFHLYKPNNPKFGTKNPTVSSNSWGLPAEVPGGNGVYSYQGGSTVAVTNRDSLSDVPFLKTRRQPSEHPYFLTTDFSFVQAGRELVDSGVIFVGSAGNAGRYLAQPTDPNFQNYYVSDPENDPSGRTMYVNRPGFPTQIGYRNGESTYKTFVIGAIDDEYTGAYANPIELNSTYLNAGSGKERLARKGEFDNSVGEDYSNRGTGIDFYAPGDGALAASSDTTIVTGTASTSKYQNPYQLSGMSGRFNDGYFSGTSFACPTAAGLIACALQNNRNFNALELKTYLKNNIENQTNFFTGIAPTSATDPNWHQVPFSTMGTPVKIIQEITNTTSTPNPTFTPQYGISSSSSVNERFTITHNTSDRNTLNIYGVSTVAGVTAPFSSSIPNGTSITLEIRNGYYLVGSNNRVSATASGGPATDSDGTQFGRLDEIAIRVDPTNNKRVQLSDSNGRDSWDDLEITVLNGTFQKVGTQIYYVFNSGSVVVPSSSISAPPLSVLSGAPGSVTGYSLNVTGNITANGDIYGLMSDDRVKENQQLISDALEKLDKLHGFTYNFNDIGEKLGFDINQRYSGVSAQDVQEVLPEAVAPAPADNDYLTVKYDKLIPLLIESLKDLKSEIDDLKDSK